MNSAGLLSGFGTVLERYRHERNLTIETLAAVSGVGEILIRCFETGQHGPTFADFLKLAHGLDVPPATLLNDVLVQWKSNPTDY